MIQIMVISFFFWGSVNSFFAKKRGRSPFNWFLIGGFFGIFSFIYLLTRKASLPTAPQPVRTDEPLPHALWYYLIDKKTHGSISTGALKKAYLEDKVSDKTFVWNDTMDDWAPLDTLPIFNQF